MDDIIHTYREDLKSKSSTAKSSHSHPKRGKYMRTASDYMSKEEFASMNGKTISYRVVPMKWEEFMKIPEDIQKHYFETIFKNFGANVSRMAVMFDVSVKTVYNRIKFLRIKIPTPNKFNLEAWNVWLNEKYEEEIQPVNSAFSPLSYSDFLKLSDEDKKAWLEFVMSNFGVQGLEFGKVFGVNPYTFRTKMYKKWGAHSGRVMRKHDFEGFVKWMGSCGVDIPKSDAEPENDCSTEGKERVTMSTAIQNPLSTSICNLSESYRLKNDIPKDEFEELGRFLKYVKSIGGSVSISISI